MNKAQDSIINNSSSMDRVFGDNKPDGDPEFDWLFNQSTLDKNFDDAIAELNNISKSVINF